MSHKNSNNSKERPVTSPKYQSDAMMQQKERDDATAVKDGDIQKVEDMDTSPQDGKHSYLTTRSRRCFVTKSVFGKKSKLYVTLKLAVSYILK